MPALLVPGTQGYEDGGGAVPALPISPAQRGVPNNHLTHWGNPGAKEGAVAVDKKVKEEEKEEEKEEYSEAPSVPILAQVEPEP